jgi:hypothetical protein
MQGHQRTLGTDTARKRRAAHKLGRFTKRGHATNYLLEYTAEAWPHYIESPELIRGFVSGSGGCSLSSASDLAFSAEPIFNFVTSFAPSLLVKLVGATTDLFRDCLGAALTRE